MKIYSTYTSKILLRMKKSCFYIISEILRFKNIIKHKSHNAQEVAFASLLIFMVHSL